MVEAKKQSSDDIKEAAALAGDAPLMTQPLQQMLEKDEWTKALKFCNQSKYRQLTWWKVNMVLWVTRIAKECEAAVFRYHQGLHAHETGQASRLP